MASAVRVALVTGANQGIGLEIVRQLCKKFDGKVLLAARSAVRGAEAVGKLREEGLQPELLVLDVCSEESIRSAKEEVKTKYGRLDVLINNAGVLFRPPTGISAVENAQQTIATNYHGVLNVTNTFLPLIQAQGRIIQMSSKVGSLDRVGKEIRDQVTSPELTIEKLTALIDQFVKDVQSPDHVAKGWPPVDEEYSTYAVSKIGVTRLAQLQAKTISNDPRRPGILVNAVHPGWVRTQMGTAAATRSIEEGADTAIYLALLPSGTTEPTGQFLFDRKPIKWF